MSNDVTGRVEYDIQWLFTSDSDRVHLRSVGETAGESRLEIEIGYKNEGGHHNREPPASSR
jgi:hypothetical protein